MSTFNLYLNTENKKWELTQDKNFRVENFAQYLSQFESVFYEKGQYFKNQLYCELKVEKEQLNIQPKYYNAIKYVRVNDYQTNTSYYYFVEKISWRSASTISLSLKMDTLNTFAPYIDYQFSNKTKINRQHKNRFSKINVCVCSQPTITSGEFVQNRVPATFTHLGVSYEGLLISWVDTSGESPQYFFTILNHEFQIFIEHISSTAPMEIEGEGFRFTVSYIGYETKLIRKIDYIDEEISPILYKKDNNELINREGDLNQDWFLVYRSSDIEATSEELTAVDCFLVPERRTQIRQPNITNNLIYPKDLEEGVNYYFRNRYYNGDLPFWTNVKMTFYYGNIIKEIDINDDGTALTENRYIQLKRNGNYILVLVFYNSTTPTLTFACDYVLVDTPSNYLTSSLDSYNNFIENRQIYTYDELNNESTGTGSFGDNTLSILNSLEDIDRTDSKLIKIIKLPYICDNFEIVDDIINISQNWVITTMGEDVNNTIRALQLKDLNTKFISQIESEHNPLKLMNGDVETYNSIYRNDENESKIYHSAFYQEKFVYDSFGFAFSLERINMEEVFEKSFEETMSFDYVMTSTINSKFLFSFTSYVTNQLGAVDYEKVLPIARNNEVVLYNNSYITYIRNGYNYDVKTKTRDDTVSWINFGLTTMGSILGFALGKYTGGATYKAGIALATASTTSLVSAISGTMQREQNLEAKQQQLKAQAGNVYGSDDVDLMSYYAENRAKWVTYQVSPIMKKAVLDLFYFLGYRDNVIGIPDVSTRTRFNFIACDVILENCVNLSEEIVNDIKKLYSSGITFIHYYDNVWDIEQIYENKERNLDYLI